MSSQDSLPGFDPVEWGNIEYDVLKDASRAEEETGDPVRARELRIEALDKLIEVNRLLLRRNRSDLGI